MTVHLPSQDPVLLTFEEDESETSELTVTQVSSFKKSANDKVSEEITLFHTAGVRFINICMAVGFFIFILPSASQCCTFQTQY